MTDGIRALSGTVTVAKTQASLMTENTTNKEKEHAALEQREEASLQKIHEEINMKLDYLIAFFQQRINKTEIVAGTILEDGNAEREVSTPHVNWYHTSPGTLKFTATINSDEIQEDAGMAQLSTRPTEGNTQSGVGSPSIGGERGLLRNPHAKQLSLSKPVPQTLYAGLFASITQAENQSKPKIELTMFSSTEASDMVFKPQSLKVAMN